MSRIDWGRRSGEEVETVAGILLSRRFGKVERIKPSQGDGGLDVIRRDPDGWTVWQVKKYSAQPNSTQRGKIEQSLNRAAEYAAKEEVPLREWILLTPVTPTTQSLEWFRNLTDRCPFDCRWHGEDYFDDLASNAQDIVDYYLRDGKGRLAVALAELNSFVHRPSGELSAIEPVTAEGSLAATHALINKLDPHFRYDFGVTAELPALQDEPGLVFASTMGRDANYVTFRVFEKQEGALEDHPIRALGQFHTPDEETRRAVRDFFDYGAPLYLAQATISANLPGGLDGSEQTGSISITPLVANETQPSHVRYQICDADENEVAIVRMRVEVVTTGIRGKNWRAVAEEWPNKTFTIEQRYTDDTDIMNLSFRPATLTGKYPDHVLVGLRFLNSLRAGNSIRMGPEFGPMNGSAHPIEKDLTHLAPNEVVELVEAISTLQHHTSAQLTIPDLTTLDVRAGNHILESARLVRGESVSVATPEVRVTPNDSAHPESGLHSVFVLLEKSVQVGEHEVRIGKVTFQAPQAALSVETEEDGAIRAIVLRPVDGTDQIHGELRWHP